MPPSVHDEFRELGFRDSNGEKTTIFTTLRLS